jgi:RimJ/RimL family protein N-acetyltransferase
MNDPTLLLPLSPTAYLRPIDVGDVTDAYVDGLNDPVVHRFLAAPRKTRQTRETVEAFVRHNIADANAIVFGVFVDGRLVGTSRVHDINRSGSPTSAYIGLALFDRRVWGQGLGTMVMGAVVAYCHERLGLDVVRGVTDRNNTVSRAMLRRTGYVYRPEADRSSDGTVMELWECPCT